MALTDRPYKPRRITSMRPESMANEIDRDRDELAAVIEDLRRRVRQLESEPRVIARFKGRTRVGGDAESVAARGLEIRDTTSTHIQFAFSPRAPSNAYHLSYTNCSGSTNANIGTIQGETRDGFELRIYDSSGALRDPRSLAFEFSLTIVDVVS